MQVGGLDVELDWSSVLSVGEQQRVAALRVLAARPTLAFLVGGGPARVAGNRSPGVGRMHRLIDCRTGAKGVRPTPYLHGDVLQYGTSSRHTHATHWQRAPSRL